MNLTVNLWPESIKGLFVPESMHIGWFNAYLWDRDYESICLDLSYFCFGHKTLSLKGESFFIEKLIKHCCSFDNDLSNFEVIPDILSRLKLFTLISINPPKDQLLFQLIEKFLKNKSISVQPKIIHHIMNFIERTYVDAFQAAEAINHLLYENNHNINLSLISDYYEQIQRPLS